MKCFVVVVVGGCRRRYEDRSVSCRICACGDGAGSGDIVVCSVIILYPKRL